MKRTVIWLMLAAGICSTAEAHAQDIPKFAEYPAHIYSGPKARIRLDTEEARQYRTRLKQASVEAVNFGGRYIFTEWGAGTGCASGGVIDVKTGAVSVLPFAACAWSPHYDRPFEVRSGSRLLVVAGMVGETGSDGAHFYEFDGKDFKYLLTRLRDGSVVRADKAPDVAEDGVPNSMDPTGTISRVIALLDDGKIPSWTDAQFYVVAKPYMTRELLATIQDGGEEARKTEQNIWDGDIVTGAQGLVRAKLFGATIASNDGRKSTVIAEIGTTDEEAEPKTAARYRYEMRLEDGAWKIDDVKSMEEWAKDFQSLKETFAGARQSVGVEPAAGPVDVAGKIETDPEMGPLWSCFQTGLKLSAQQIAEAAPDERRYISAVMGLGGFMTIGDEIRAACNSAIDGEAALKSEKSQKINDLFVASLFAIDTNLLKKCEDQSDTDPLWKITKQQCDARAAKYMDIIHLR